ncbi:hypothetical protein WEI85_45545 [Actinomycetes bacterium KLBMP 9797]
MDTDAELYAAAARAEPLLRRIPGVTGVGVGPKRVGGVAQPVGAIEVFVERKRPLSELDPDEVIPAAFEGFPTNVSTLTSTELFAALIEAPPGEPTGTRKPPPADEFDMQIAEPVLIGGGPISGRVDDTSKGTLGLLMQDVADPTRAYALTCFHVLCKLKGRHCEAGPLREQTLVGQVNPDGSLSCSHCCDDVFGTFVQGQYFEGTWRDMALVRLKPGTTYIGGIKQQGRVHGIAIEPTVAEMAAETYLVRKYGYGTRFTGGRVVKTLVDPVGTTQFLVVPHKPGNLIQELVYFSYHGDSGAAVVTPDGKVLGIMRGGAFVDAAEFIPGATGKVNVTMVTALNRIMREFREVLNPRFNVTPVLATSVNDIRTVPAHVTATLDGEELAVRMPSAASVAGSAATAPRVHEIRNRVRTDLSASPLGAEIVRLWERHSAEVVNLVNHDRQVLATWHRSGASAVYQRLARFADMSALTTARLPHTVNDAPLAECVARMHAVLTRRGSAELRAALDEFIPRLPDLAGLTYPQILEALNTTQTQDDGVRA